MRDMQLRTHPKRKWEGFSNWAPAWAGSYGRADTFPMGEEGVLTGVEIDEAGNTLPRCLTLTTMEHGRMARRRCFAATTRRMSSLASSRFLKAASAGR